MVTIALNVQTVQKYIELSDVQELLIESDCSTNEEVDDDQVVTSVRHQSLDKDDDNDDEPVDMISHTDAKQDIHVALQYVENTYGYFVANEVERLNSLGQDFVFKTENIRLCSLVIILFLSFLGTVHTIFFCVFLGKYSTVVCM